MAICSLRPRGYSPSFGRRSHWRRCRICSANSGNAEFQQRAQQRFITTDVERIEAILSNARDRGEVTGSADARLTCAVLLGVAFTWLYVFRWDVPEDLAQRLATFVVAALTS
jgi:hypothetical protein